jgi:hypothetical protein
MKIVFAISTKKKIVPTPEMTVPEKEMDTFS